MSEQVAWPPDYVREYARRTKIYKATEKADAVTLSKIKLHYKHNPIDFINDWCVTEDPRSTEGQLRVMPFVLFKRQKEFVQFIQGCIKDQQNGLTEKSRDVGASWLCVALSIWLWLFWPYSAVGFGSQNIDKVDFLGDPGTIFHKIRLTVDYLPKFFLPRGFNKDVHATYLRLINPENGSSVIGQGGKNIGRGGRTTIFFKDEAAHYEKPLMIEAALSENTRVQIDISSVNGNNNPFYNRRMAGEIWEPEKEMTPGKTRVFIFDWRDHPGKDQEWYDERKAKYESEGMPHVVGQELDRDYTASVERIVIPRMWVNAAVDAHKKLGFGFNNDRMAALDPYDEGGDRHALTVRNGPILVFAEHWTEGDTGDATRKSVSVCQSLETQDMYFDSPGVGAGAKSEGNRLTDVDNPDRIRFNFIPWMPGASPEDPDENIIPGDENSPTNRAYYANKKAQAAWSLRLRFEKTYKAVTFPETYKYEPHELISIPSELPALHDLCEQLCQPTYKYRVNGQILINKKGEGSKSPNLFDSLVMCYWGTANIQGDVFSWDSFKTCKIDGDNLPRISLLFQSVYPNYEEQTGGGYKTSITLGVFNPKMEIERGRIKTSRPGPYPEESLLVLDCWKDKLPFSDLMAAIGDDYNSLYGNDDREIDFVLLEDSDSTKPIVKELSFAQIKTFTYNPGTRDKLALAHSVTHLVENGLVWFPQSSRVAGKAMDKFLPLIKEVTAYNRTPSQEYVHAFTLALRFCSDRGHIRVPEIGYREPEYQKEKKKVNPYAQ